MNLRTLDRLHQTRLGLAIFGLAELAFGYWALLWAFDSDRLTAWFLTIVLVIGGLQNLVKLTMRFVRHVG